MSPRIQLIPSLLSYLAGLSQSEHSSTAHRVQGMGHASAPGTTFVLQLLSRQVLPKPNPDILILSALWSSVAGLVWGAKSLLQVILVCLSEGTRDTGFRDLGVKLEASTPRAQAGIPSPCKQSDRAQRKPHVSNLVPPVHIPSNGENRRT